MFSPQTSHGPLKQRAILPLPVKLWFGFSHNAERVNNRSLQNNGVGAVVITAYQTGGRRVEEKGLDLERDKTKQTHYRFCVWVEGGRRWGHVENKRGKGKKWSRCGMWRMGDPCFHGCCSKVCREEVKGMTDWKCPVRKHNRTGSCEQTGTSFLMMYKSKMEMWCSVKATKGKREAFTTKMQIIWHYDAREFPQAWSSLNRNLKCILFKHNIKKVKTLRWFLKLKFDCIPVWRRLINGA